MKGPVIHVGDKEDMIRYVAYLYNVPKLQPDQPLDDKMRSCYVYKWPAEGRDLFAQQGGYFDTMRPPDGTTHRSLLRVNSFDQFKRYLNTYLA